MRTKYIIALVAFSVIRWALVSVSSLCLFSSMVSAPREKSGLMLMVGALAED